MQASVEKLSVYILTYNSPQYLPQVLGACKMVADEIVIVDSGSTDNTLDVARSYNCKIFHRALDNFREQRNFAHQCCSNKWVLAVDSDEIPSPELVAEIKRLKEGGFQQDAYRIKRNWNVLGKWVHAIVPISCPDYPIRLLNKEIVVFDERSTRSHETAHGYKTLGIIESALNHYTFETKEILNNKLELYARLRAEDIIEMKRPVSVFKMLFSPLAAWLKFYFIKQNWKDGYTGIVLANFAARYTYRKYKYARLLKSGA